MGMFNRKKNCIVCHRQVEKEIARKKFGVWFCSDKCLTKYEKILTKAKKDATLDKCCD